VLVIVAMITILHPLVLSCLFPTYSNTHSISSPPQNPPFPNIILPTKLLIAKPNLDPILHPAIPISYLPPTISHASHQLRMRIRLMGSWGCGICYDESIGKVIGIFLSKIHLSYRLTKEIDILSKSTTIFIKNHAEASTSSRHRQASTS
jgi:hypothetical protein